jgi:hypothetical protein
METNKKDLNTFHVLKALTVMIYRLRKIWSWLPVGPAIKNDCADEVQHLPETEAHYCLLEVKSESTVILIKNIFPFVRPVYIYRL